MKYRTIKQNKKRWPDTKKREPSQQDIRRWSPKQFPTVVTLRLNLGVSTFFCRLLLQMARIDMD